MHRSVESYLSWWQPYFLLTTGYRKALLASMQRTIDTWGRALADQLENLPFTSSAGFNPLIGLADDQRILRCWLHWQECMRQTMRPDTGLSDSLALTALLSRPGSLSGDSDKILAQLIRLMPPVTGASSQVSDEPEVVAKVRPGALVSKPPGRRNLSKRSGGQ